MSEKLARAQHTRAAVEARAPRTATVAAASADATPNSTAELFVGGSHAGIDRTLPFAPDSTAAIPVVGKHAGIDRTRRTATPAAEREQALDALYGNDAQTPAPRRTRSKSARGAADANASHPASAPAASSPTTLQAPETTGSAQAVSSSAALISVCVMISRITGFARTWAMAFALGSTLLSSSYQVANNLPNMLYELVAGGMIVTAFLPVYLSVKKKLGAEAGNRYASNLLTCALVLLGIVALLCMAFPAQIIFTQSFWSNQEDMATSVFLFQFFAIQIVFYGVSAIVSGLLNANRDYLWSSIAPVANNVIVIATFLAYALIAPNDPVLALYVLAVGNPLGVFVQMAIQLPALRRNGIRIRPRLDLRDPALRETLALGVPAVVVMLCSTAIVSVQSAASYAFSDAGPSILFYARLWFMLPYSFLAVPITTAMFTELADMHAEGDLRGMKRGIVSGTNQILFFMIPFALHLIVFATPLVTLYCAGEFTAESIGAIASYLAVFALSLPFYGVNTYLQKVFSSLRKMHVFAVFNIVAAAVQIGLTGLAVVGAQHGVAFATLECIAVAELMFYLVGDFAMFVYLRRRLGSFGLRSTARAFMMALVLGAAGAAVGGALLVAAETFIAPLSGSIPQALLYVVVCGLTSLVVTFGAALKLRVPEASFLTSLVGKVARKLGRG